LRLSDTQRRNTTPAYRQRVKIWAWVEMPMNERDRGGEKRVRRLVVLRNWSRRNGQAIRQTRN
jgi:hypothetical protein